ncbi:MAG: hypothetical protein QXV17_12800 [Candidatus Micrarchaeaceae archaeon]
MTILRYWSDLLNTAVILISFLLVFNTISAEESQLLSDQLKNDNSRIILDSGSTVLTAVSPIYPKNSQTIYINGTNLGSNLQTEPTGNGGVDTIACNITPSITIRDNGNERHNWSAGHITSNNFDDIGIYIESWSSSQIILGGFDSALSNGSGTWNIGDGDPLQIEVWGINNDMPGYFNTTVSSVTSVEKTYEINGWKNINSMAVSRNKLLAVGSGSFGNGGAIGILNISQDTFENLSYLIPSYYGPLTTVSSGNNVFAIGGSGTTSNPTSNFGILYNNLTFVNLSSSLLSNGSFGWLNSIASNGNSFLLAGASHGFTPLDFYYPESNQFVSLTWNVPYYFATNSVVWNNKIDTYFISGAGAGSFPYTEATFGSIAPSTGSFTDYSYLVDSNLNAVWQIGSSGQYFLLYGSNSSGNGYYLWQTGTNNIYDLTSQFPSDLSVGDTYSNGTVFLIGGGLSNNASFLARYYPNNGTLTMYNNESLISNFTFISSIVVNAGELYLGGKYGNHAELEIFSNVSNLKEGNYLITFTDSGLPSGTTWYVNLSNCMDSGAITESSYSFFLTNGTYSYSIGSVSGYTASPSSGSLTVSGNNITKVITFTATSIPSTNGISRIELYGIIGVVVAAAVIGSVLAIMRKKR